MKSQKAKLAFCPFIHITALLLFLRAIRLKFSRRNSVLPQEEARPLQRLTTLLCLQHHRILSLIRYPSVSGCHSIPRVQRQVTFTTTRLIKIMIPYTIMPVTARLARSWRQVYHLPMEGVEGISLSDTPSPYPATDSSQGLLYGSDQEWYGRGLSPTCSPHAAPEAILCKTDEEAGDDAVSANEDTKAEEPYAKLIHRALLGTPNHSMALQEIYQWFIDNTDKGSSSGSGWRNSIRHNLSMNAVRSTLPASQLSRF